MSQNLPERSLRDFLSLRHPNHFVLAGANNRNVIITYRFLAAPVQANRDFFLAYWLYISAVSTFLNVCASYLSAFSGFRPEGNYIVVVVAMLTITCDTKSSLRQKCLCLRSMLASHAGVFRGARFSSLPTNACSAENNIPFPLFYLRGKWQINICVIKCWQAKRD